MPGVFTILFINSCCLPSWDRSFFCSSRISGWDIALSLAWFSMWILRVSVGPSETLRPWPDTNLDWEAAAEDRIVPHWGRFHHSSWNTKKLWSHIQESLKSMSVSTGRFCGDPDELSWSVFASLSFWAAIWRAKMLFFPLTEEGGA